MGQQKSKSKAPAYKASSPSTYEAAPPAQPGSWQSCTFSSFLVLEASTVPSYDGIGILYLHVVTIIANLSVFQ